MKDGSTTLMKLLVAHWLSQLSGIKTDRLRLPMTCTAYLYIPSAEHIIWANFDRLDHQDTTNVDSRGIAFTIRSVFIIDPKKTIRVILSYPASTGRNTLELLRVVDSLQSTDKYRIVTPINWTPGDDVIIHSAVDDEEASTLFPDYRTVKPYLRYTPLSKEAVLSSRVWKSSGGKRYRFV